jgi:hypothetical protein
MINSTVRVDCFFSADDIKLKRNTRIIKRDMWEEGFNGK